eukprot:gene5806-9026_t
MSKTDRAVRLSEKRLKSAWENEEFYEAQELVVSLTNRLRGQQQYDRAAKILEEGMENLLSHGKDNAAAQLVKPYLDVLTEAPHLSPSTKIDYFLKLSKQFSDNSSKLMFLRRAISATTQANSQHGDCKLHLEAAKSLLEDEDSIHAALEQLVMSGFEVVSFKDTFLILTQQSLEQLLVAAYTSRDLAQEIYDGLTCSSAFESESKPLQFCRFVLLTLTRDAVQLLDDLRKAYHDIIDTELDTVASNFRLDSLMTRFCGFTDFEQNFKALLWELQQYDAISRATR